MGRKISLKLWKGSSPEPQDYNLENCNGGQTTFEAGRETMSEFIDIVSARIEEWLNDHTLNLDSQINRLKSVWKSKGGSGDLFDDCILPKAFEKSNYARLMSKEANAFIKG
jgi:hypothetical protein